MEKCQACSNYSETYNELCQEMDDIRKSVCYHCIMYDDVIPTKIVHDEDDCPFYNKNGSDK